MPIDPYGFETSAEEVSDSSPLTMVFTVLFVLANLLCAGCEGGFSVFCMVNTHQDLSLVDDIGAGLIIAGPAFIFVGIALVTIGLYFSFRRWWVILVGTVVGGAGGGLFWFLSFFATIVWKLALS